MRACVLKHACAAHATLCRVASPQKTQGVICSNLLTPLRLQFPAPPQFESFLTTYKVSARRSRPSGAVLRLTCMCHVPWQHVTELRKLSMLKMRLAHSLLPSKRLYVSRCAAFHAGMARDAG